MKYFQFIFITAKIFISSTIYAQLTPQEAIGQMIPGTNNRTNYSVLDNKFQGINLRSNEIIKLSKILY